MVGLLTVYLTVFDPMFFKVLNLTSLFYLLFEPHVGYPRLLIQYLYNYKLAHTCINFLTQQTMCYGPHRLHEGINRKTKTV